MQTKIQRWGNSQGLRISKDLLANASLQVGDEVDVSLQDGALVIKPVKKVRGRYRLEDLVACIPGDYQPEEVDWGEPSGKEAW